MNIRKILSLIMTVVFTANYAVPSFALPQGEQVQSGSATFDRSGNELNIHQATDQLVTNYQSFSIAGNEAVNFIQPGSSSIALNRVVGADASSIMGRLTANGQVFLINPNGVVFGGSAHIDTAGLVASTLDISNNDFLAGRYNFSNAGAGVVNYGAINSPGGYVYLLGSHVANAGLIETQVGQVVLASGNKMTLDLDPQGTIAIAINEPLGNAPGVDDAVKNSGTINADGGRVVMTARVLDGLVKNSVNNEGVITAGSLINKDGAIYLVAKDPGGVVKNSGTLNASAKEVDANGGYIDVSGSKLDLAGGHLSASGLGTGKLGSVLLDPDFFIIDNAWRDQFRGWDGSNLTVFADKDVNFELTGNVLDFKYFDTETFTVHAGRDINLNDDKIVTPGGNVNLLADAGNINLSAPIITNGGNVDIQATVGDVIHTPTADVSTSGGNFRGKAGHDYILDNGVSIHSGNGKIDIYAGNDIVLGTPGTTTVRSFEWKYISDTRLYALQEFGYYTVDGLGNVTFNPFSSGTDIGKINDAPSEGTGLYSDGQAFKFYAKFDRGTSGYFAPGDDSGVSHWTYFQDTALNPDGLGHVHITGDKYGFEDIYKLGDADFDDLVMSFKQSVINVPPGATLYSNTDTFLTAKNGAITQNGGTIHSNNLVLKANEGIGGTGGAPLETDVNNIAANNGSSGDIKIHNSKDLMIKDLTGLTGLNPETVGQTGITNTAPNGAVGVDVDGNLLIDAPINAKGDVTLNADGSITHTVNGDVTIDNGIGPFIGPPTDVKSPSHQTSTWSNDSTIDVTWRLPTAPAGAHTFTVTAGDKYIMNPGSTVNTNHGDATVNAANDIALALIDAGLGIVTVKSNNGNVIDADAGVAPSDFDLIGRTINVSAPNGTVGGPGAGEEIDYGHPYTFSHIFDESPATDPDATTDTYGTLLDGTGNWLFSTTYATPHDGDSWNFHVRTVDQINVLVSTSVHLGPFFIDTIAPVITATYEPDADGTYDHNVTVDFSATDERSGFDPLGDLSKTLPSQSTSGNGNYVFNSGNVTDRAGNVAVPVSVPLKVSTGTTPPVEPPVEPPVTPPVTPPGPPTPPLTPGLLTAGDEFGNLLNPYKVYYEILSPSQFLSIEPALKIGLFAYHPLTETDETQYNEFKVDAGAYEVIEDNIKLKKELPGYFKE